MDLSPGQISPRQAQDCVGLASKLALIVALLKLVNFCLASDPSLAWYVDAFLPEFLIK